MAFKMKGSAFKLNNVATKSAFKQDKWYKNEDGSANTELLKERGFKLDPTSGRYLTEENLTPNQWGIRMYEHEKEYGGQRKNNVSTNLAGSGVRKLTDEEKYKTN
tara:strand:- start:16 stop:330 length:315 start_codon:yes stop_codon:yes gene_type:complete